MIVDFRSDTVTKPSAAMLEHMMKAELGDDVFGEDPTVNELERRMAELIGHEAALFCASGTMANQVAIKAQTQPMDEIIAHELCHIYYYETGGYAFNSGVSIKLAKGERGIMSAEDVERNIQPIFDWLPRTSLVSIENTCNKGGGSCYDLDTMAAISAICRKHELKLHIDGARIFNALAACDYTAKDVGDCCDTISICFSKGMGAPVGSILTGPAATIKKARRIRKVFGGGMRQAGILAAACLYALDHNIDLLQHDHRRAHQVAGLLAKLPWVTKVHKVETNIVLFDVADERSLTKALKGFSEKGIKMMAFGPRTIRAITHLDIGDQHIHYVGEVSESLSV